MLANRGDYKKMFRYKLWAFVNIHHGMAVENSHVDGSLYLGEVERLNFVLHGVRIVLMQSSHELQRNSQQVISLTIDAPVDFASKLCRKWWFGYVWNKSLRQENISLGVVILSYFIVIVDSYDHIFKLALFYQRRSFIHIILFMPSCFGQSVSLTKSLRCL